MQQKLQQAGALLKKVKTYWGHPVPGRYMPFREIAAYAGGGIGAYFVMCLGMACILGTGNTLVMSTLGVAPTDLYIMYDDRTARGHYRQHAQQSGQVPPVYFDDGRSDSAALRGDGLVPVQSV